MKKTEIKLKNVEQLSLIKPDNGDEQLLSDSLSVVKEVREQLAAAYIENVESKKTIEHLTAEVSKIKDDYTKTGKTTEMLQAELDAFKARDVEAKTTAYNKRLEKLSASFGALGQIKTVEQLSAMPKEAIKEFESITQIALTSKQQEKLSTLTVPTQSMSKRQQEKLEAVEKKPEQLNKDFMKGVCDVLIEQQSHTGKDSKRIISL